MSPTTHSPTMIFLRNAIEESPKTQREIAQDAGFANPNALSMMKTGECKVPISRIPALAEALGIDPEQFLKTALREYHPEIWMTIEELMRPKLHEVHEEIIEVFEMAHIHGPIQWSEALREALAGVFYLANLKYEEEKGKRGTQDHLARQDGSFERAQRTRCHSRGSMPLAFSSESAGVAH